MNSTLSGLADGEQDIDTQSLPWDEEQAMKVTGGRRTLAIELLEMLLEDAPKRLGTLEDNLAMNDLTAAAETAHTIAGGAGHCAALPLRQASKSLEQTLREQRQERIEPDLEVLRSEIERLKSFSSSLR